MIPYLSACVYALLQLGLVYRRSVTRYLQRHRISLRLEEPPNNQRVMFVHTAFGHMYPNEATREKMVSVLRAHHGESEKRGKSSTLMLTYRLMMIQEQSSWKQVGGWEEKCVHVYQCR